jgi:hypothetical protein
MLASNLTLVSFPEACPGHQVVKRLLSPGPGPWVSHLWDVIVVVIITFIIGNGRWVRVWARGDKILITELDFIVTGGVTIIFCNKA